MRPTPLRCNDSRTGDCALESETARAAQLPSWLPTITLWYAKDLMSLIGRRPEIQVIAEASNGREAVEQILCPATGFVLLVLS